MSIADPGLGSDLISSWVREDHLVKSDGGAGGNFNQGRLVEPGLFDPV